MDAPPGKARKIPRRVRERRRRRIAYLTLDYGIDLLGTKGASVHVRSICSALASRGVQVAVHCTRVGEGEWPERRRGIEIIHHPLPKEFQSFRKLLREVYGGDLSMPPEVRQAAINRDAIEFLREGWRRSPPRAVVERLSLFGVAGLRVAREMGIPHLLEVNALLSDEAKAHRSLSDYATARRVEDEVLQGTDRVLAVSEPLRQAIIARGAAPDRVEVLPNGYDERLFSPTGAMSQRRRLKIARRFCVGMVGSMKAWHGVGTLLSAFRELAARRPEVALVFVGEGPEIATVSAFQSLHPELLVICTGPVDHSRVPGFIQAFDVAVAPYEKSEHFYFSPMKVYEYLAMGKAVVASDQGQIRDAIQDGRNGLLFEPENVNALVGCLLRLLESPALRSRLARQARASVRGHTWNANARRILQILDGIAR